jgi:hypothetical protein
MAIRITETGVTYLTIQNAIDGVLSGTGLTSDRTIEIDGGTYSESLTFNGATHKTNNYTLTLKSVSSNVILDGGGTANNNIYILNLSNLTFDGISCHNCNVEDSAGANVRILGTSGTWGRTDNIIFKNSTIRIGYAAVRCTDYVRNVTFQNITTSNCKYGTFRFGKQQVDLENINFINCNITTDGLQDSGANQFQLKGINGLNIIRCNLDGAEKIMLSPWYCDNVVVDGCIFNRPGILSTTGRFILFEDSCDNWVIRNCLFLNCTRTGAVYGTNMTEISFINNTFIDTTGNKTEFFYLSNINGLYMYNNIYQVNGSGTIGFIRIVSSTLNTIGTKFITSNNIVHYINGTQRNLYNGSSGGTTLPNGGVSAAQGVGLETSSLQSTSTGNYVLFTDPSNLDYTLQESSPARNIALLSVLPTKDLRNYTRDVVSSDIGAYDMNGIPPILPQSILTISVAGVSKASAFGIPESTQVVFGNNSTNAITTTFEIYNSNNTVIASTSTFPYSYTFVSIGVYKLKMISTNNDGSDILELTNYVTVDTLPTPQFTVPSAPVLVNGETATASIIDSSTGGVTINGGITSKLWDIVDELNNSIYQSNSTPFLIIGSEIPQGTYGVKLTVSNIVGSASLTLSSSMRVNRSPVVSNLISNQVGTALNAFSYSIPSNTFYDGTDSLSYSISSGPSWLSLAGFTLSGTPNIAGQSSVVIRAQDQDGLSTTTSFSINVGTGNPPLVVNQPDNKSVEVGNQFIYKVTSSIFYAPSPLSISVVSKPNWLNYIEDEMIIVGEPSESDIGTGQIIIRADDGFTQADCIFNVEVYSIENLQQVSNGEQMSSIRTKLNKIIDFINKF